MQRWFGISKEVVVASKVIVSEGSGPFLNGKKIKLFGKCARVIVVGDRLLISGSWLLLLPMDG